MSGDEFLVLLASGTVALVGLVRWYRHHAPARTLSRGVPWIAAAPLAALGLLLAVLVLWSSWDVRGSFLYTAFYLLMGAAWLVAVARTVSFLGIDSRGDVAERGNAAAAAAVSGALVGGTLAFAGGNVGDGPGWWVVVFCGILSTGSLFLLWGLMEWLTRVSEAVTVDRDLASGLRLGAFLAAAGLVLGRSVAGDWTSAGEAANDLVEVGWPATGLAVLAAFVQRLLRPTPERPAGDPWAAGVVPGLLYLGIAAAAVANAGPW